MTAFCLKCKDKPNCKKICPALEKYLSTREVAGYSERHKRRKEILFDPNIIEKLEDRSCGRRIRPLIYNDNYES